MVRKTRLPKVTLSEEQRIQALGAVAPDLPPSPGKHNCTGRDYEYKRHGTVSILATLDLHDGKIIAQVHDSHRSREFIRGIEEMNETPVVFR